MTPRTLYSSDLRYRIPILSLRHPCPRHFEHRISKTQTTVISQATHLILLCILSWSTQWSKPETGSHADLLHFSFTQWTKSCHSILIAVRSIPFFMHSTVTWVYSPHFLPWLPKAPPHPLALALLPEASSWQPVFQYCSISFLNFQLWAHGP